MIMNSKKILFACDLDNTLIHSYRHKIENDICVEIFSEREQSFITSYTRELLKKLPDNIMLLPVTTRSVEQYMRINWDNSPEYALAVNGTILLKNNIPFMREDIGKYIQEIENLKNKINPEDFLKVKFVDDMYLFAYCDEASDVKSLAEKYSEMTNLDTQYSGRKIYFFPPPADKGEAVKKFALKYDFDFIISAGDSTIDFPMLEIANIAIVPDSETAGFLKNPNLKICPENKVFSEFILETVLSL